MKRPKTANDASNFSEDILDIHQKIDLSKLPSAEGAAFDSYVDDPDDLDDFHGKCHPKTRIDLLRQIREWADDPHGKNIFWLNGMAGTGKSTISRTVAQSFADHGQLGASFFFKRGEGERSKASRFFTTMTAQLVRSVPAIIPHVREAIDADPDISGKLMKDQFEKLIFRPLSKIEQPSAPLSKLVIVVDALDECERKGDIKNILQSLSQIQHLESIRVRIFLTSRPELPIRDGFKEFLAEMHQDVILQDISQATIEHDISTFLENKFVKIRKKYNNFHPADSSLTSLWPSESSLRILTKMASPSFIFAATICRFIGDDRWDPNEQLATIKKYQTSSQASQLDKTYLPVLDKLLLGLSISQQERLALEFRMVIGSIVVLADPLSTISLAGLLDIPKKILDERLLFLHSVLRIPSNPDSPLRLFHLSFRDFLLDPEKQGKSEFWFWIDERKTHEMLATRCIKLMSEPNCLRENMWHLDSASKLRRKIDGQTIDKCMPADIQYACRYWVHHLEQSGRRIYDQDAVHIFFQKHFLHWLEALSLIGVISESITMISTLQSLSAVS